MLYDQYDTYDTYDQYECLQEQAESASTPYGYAYQKFLNLGLEASVAMILATGHNRFDLISDDWDNPVRMAAFKVYDDLAEANYWGNVES